jgi:hypothetical protein
MRLITHVFRLSILFALGSISCAKASDLHRQFDDSHITEIIVAEGSTHSLRIESSRAISLGVATVLVSPNGGKLSFHSALKLANELSIKGWHVDVVSDSWLSIPVEASATTITEQPTSSAVVQPWMSSLPSQMEFDGLSQHLQVMMNVVNANSANINGFRLVIAEGIVAALLLNLDETFTGADAVTLIGPFWPDTTINQTLAEKSASFSVPILDLDFASSNRFAHSTSALRAKKARIGIKLNYRQRLFPVAQRHNTIDWIGGEIVGWTRSLGW